MDITDADIQNLRTAFFRKISESGLSETEDFHPADIQRIRTSREWLMRFLLHQECNQQEALNMLWECCQWRKSFGVNDISEETVNAAILKEGSVFAHNRDKDGKVMLIFKSKLHVKDKYDFEDLKRVLVYWMERLERETNGDKMSVFFDCSGASWVNVDIELMKYMISVFNSKYPKILNYIIVFNLPRILTGTFREGNGDQISIFFDMAGAGLSNMDTDYTKYVIGLFKVYYPYYLNNIYVFEMAWVLGAVFKLIKSWLPPKAVQKIKTVSKSNLQEYVSADQALVSWGGTDDYKFEFVSEVRSPVVEVEKKKVHFADGSPVNEESKAFGDANSASPSPTHKLTINPADIIQFATEAGETSATVRLSNEDSCPISYKIKTTSPEKFRVRPSSGQLAPGAGTTISVVLQSAYDGPGIQRDKFMIMAVSVTPDVANLDSAELWKNASNVMQHRLRCSMPLSKTNDSPRNGPVQDGDRQLTKLSAEVSKLHNDLHNVADEVRRIQIQQWVLLLLVGLLTAMTMYLVKQEPTGLPPDTESCNRPALP